MRINYAFIGRIAILAFLGLFLIIVETAVMPGLRVLGAVPNLMLPTAVCVSVTYGEREGALFGLCVGFASDVLGSSPFMFSALFYMSAAYFIGTFVKLYVSPGILSALTGCTAALLVRQLFVIFYMLGTWGHLPITSAFLYKLLPELTYSMALSPIIYGLARLAYKINGGDGQHGVNFLR